MRMTHPGPRRPHRRALHHTDRAVECHAHRPIITRTVTLASPAPRRHRACPTHRRPRHRATHRDPSHDVLRGTVGEWRFAFGVEQHPKPADARRERQEGAHHVPFLPVQIPLRHAITGRYVTAATTARQAAHDPDQRHEHSRASGTAHRSAIAGRYVTAATAARHPRTTTTKNS